MNPGTSFYTPLAPFQGVDHFTRKPRVAPTLALGWGLLPRWGRLPGVLSLLSFGGLLFSSALAAQGGGSLRITPDSVTPGKEVVVSMTVPGEKATANRYYFKSDDPVNCPINAMIDSADSAIVKSGPWNTHGPAKMFYGGTFINCPDAGGSLEIPFTGEFFRIYGFKAANRGMVEIFLDGQSLGEVDTYATKDEPSALLFEKYGLKNTQHVVKFVVTGKKNGQSTGDQVSFDAMESGVAGVETKATPTADGIYEIQALSVAGAPVAKACVRVGMNRPGAGVRVFSTNEMLQRVFDGIIRANLKNEERMADGRRVLVEGDIWRGIWLETQPMGGEMYGKFDLEIARNNIEVAMAGQREDGLLPHLTNLDGKKFFGTGIPDYEIIGFNSLAQYGLDIYYLLKKDAAFLDKLEKALEGYDAYLWKVRDKHGNGVLEAYCSSDTGEDGQTGNRYELFRDPDGKRFVESVMVTADSYANRAVLAQIAAIRGDEAKRKEWQQKADALQAKAKEYFWVEEKKAAFDRDSKGEILPTLNQLNIRGMTQGLFTQSMADDFIKYHLMNPKEFFTAYPIPSTAINDPTFQNVEKASEYATWSGPSQGLTLQRGVRALESYGHYAEMGLIGERLLNRIGREPVVFPVQFNPLTGDAVAASGPYGPMILAAMEYFSRMYGVYVSRENVVWNGLSVGDGKELEYNQTWQDHEYKLVNKGGRVSGFCNGVKKFEVPVGLRVETDYDGNVRKIAGLAATKVTGKLLLGSTVIEHFTTGPNQVHSIQSRGLKPEPSALFFQ
jgi:hypothetical protein